MDPTRRIVGAHELRRIIGRARLEGAAIAVAGGEWRRETGDRWRFWKARAPRTAVDPAMLRQPYMND